MEELFMMKQKLCDESTLWTRLTNCNSLKPSLWDSDARAQRECSSRPRMLLLWYLGGQSPRRGQTSDVWCHAGTDVSSLSVRTEPRPVVYLSISSALRSLHSFNMTSWAWIPAALHLSDNLFLFTEYSSRIIVHNLFTFMFYTHSCRLYM